MLIRYSPTSLLRMSRSRLFLKEGAGRKSCCWCLGLGRIGYLFLPLAITLVASLSSPLVQAQEALWEQHMTPNELVPNQLAPVAKPNLSVERAIRIVRRETGGRVLAASAGKRQGSPGVNVRTLLDGERVTTFFVYADGRLQKR